MAPRATLAPSATPVPTAAAVPTPARMAFIDSLRLVAAVLVLAQHLFEKRDGLIKAWLIPLAPGVAGVAIFFFISGYVIPMAVRGKLEPRAFMIRRVFRIFPLYLATLAVMAAAGATLFLPRLGVIADAPLHVWVANVLLFADYVGLPVLLGVSWTLAVELVWYALFAASVVAFGSRAADRLDLLVPLTLGGLALLSLVIDARIPLGRPLMIYAAVIGCQCYRYHSGALTARGLARSIAVFAIVALAATGIAFGVFRHPNLTLAQAMGPWAVGTILFLIVVLCPPVRTWRAINHGLLPVLGTMSYSIYLLHPTAAATANVYLPAGYQIAGALALTSGLAWLGYNLIERPGIALGRVVAGARPRPMRLGQV